MNDCEHEGGCRDRAERRQTSFVGEGEDQGEEGGDEEQPRRAARLGEELQPPTPSRGKTTRASSPRAAATPPAQEPKSAAPAPYASKTARGVRIAGRKRTTRVGSTPASRAVNARAPCQSGNAYPGLTPAFERSSTTPIEVREPASSSFRTRARWKRASLTVGPRLP